MSAPSRLRAGFTLVELLTVIGIISVLAGILFPVFLTARGKAREISCVSNMRQIGLAIRMYTQDYDERYPWAVDPTDKLRPEIWSGFPQFQQYIPFMPYLHVALQPYIKSADLFRCPSDAGYTVEDFTGVPLNAQPSSFEKFGTSYNYRTEISFRQFIEGAFQQPASINMLMDASGRWHGGIVNNWYRYDVLHGDGHVKNLSFDQVEMEWQQPL